MEEVQEYAKHIARCMLSILWGVSARKTSVYIPKPFWEIGQGFDESLWAG